MGPIVILMNLLTLARVKKHAVRCHLKSNESAICLIRLSLHRVGNTDKIKFLADRKGYCEALEYNDK